MSLFSIAGALLVGGDLGNPPGFKTWRGVTVNPGDDESTATALLAAVLGKVQSDSHQAWASADDIPEELRLLIFQVAARYWVNPRGIVREGAGPYSASYASATEGIYFTKEERGILARYSSRPGGIKVVSTIRGDIPINDDFLGGFEYV